MTETQQPLEGNQEALSLEVAQRKLTRLLGQQFDEFGVRFMNIAEYEQIMGEKRLVGGEVLVFRQQLGEGKLYENFADFLAWAKKDWYWTIRHYTDWSYSGFQAQSHDAMMKLLWQAHEEAVQKENVPQNIEARTVALFREKLRNYLKGYETLANHHLHTAEKKLVWRGQEYPSTMQEVRSIFHEAAHSSSSDAVCREDGPDKATRPFQLAMIVDTKALLRDSYNSGVTKNGAEWSNLNMYGANASDHLLGTIGIMSDSDVMRSLMRHAKTEGEWAHAVFDKHGSVRFPR